MMLASISLLAYAPFIDPLPLWNGWAWWALPLCLGVAVVYKCTKCERMADVPMQSLVIFIWMILGLVGSAAALYGLVAVMKVAAGG
jgi:hypothetical protein